MGLGILASVPFIAAIRGAKFAASFAITGGILTLACYTALFSPKLCNASLLQTTGLRSSELTFQDVDSSKLKTVLADQNIAGRKDFLQSGLEFPPPLIG